MNIQTLVLGSHVLFSRAGTVVGTSPSTHTVSGLWKPPVADPAEPPVPDPNWPEIGTVEKFVLSPKNTYEPKRGPAPGAYVDLDQICTGKSTMLSVTLNDLSELSLEMLFGASGAITDDFVPLAGDGQVKGWFKFQQYDGGNVDRTVVDYWGVATVKPITFESKLVKVEMDILVLYSALNSGTISLG